VEPGHLAPAAAPRSPPANAALRSQRGNNVGLIAGSIGSADRNAQDVTNTVMPVTGPFPCCRGFRGEFATEAAVGFVAARPS